MLGIVAYFLEIGPIEPEKEKINGFVAKVPGGIFLWSML